FVRRHQVGVFFTVALGFSWAAFVPYARAEDGIPWFTFGPAIAAILMAALIGGWSALKTLLASVIRWHVAPVWYLVALGLPFLIQLVAVWLNPRFGAPAPNWSAIPPLAQVLPMVALFAVFSGPLGEEIGWRGFALPRLLERHSALMASLILGAVWAVWHLPLILVDDFTTYGAFMPVIAAIVFTWVHQNTRGSVLLAILMHVSHQNSVRYLGRVYTNADQVQQQWIGVGLWILAVAVLLAVYGPRRFVSVSNRSGAMVDSQVVVPGQ
ncbi:MAG TPA: CPBP family intramembrane glutamic endopeptidase, partial [Rubellimicrobium sp.]|nr:CPBP family intramembrane glutamic endopeptidase [Rubellimicrobium sp.]